MERINGQEVGLQELAKQVLLWITCAKMPLTTLELQHSLAVEVGAAELDEDNLPEIEDMVSVCAGLVTVDEESDIVRLVHYTTQEYFERTQLSWFPNAQTDITETCVTYLSFDAFETGFCATIKEFEARLQLNPLYSYASRNWGHHARADSREVEESILSFLESEAKVSASSQAMMAFRGSYHSQGVPNRVIGAHLAASFGLRDTLVALLKNGHDPDIKDSHGRTPLWIAAENGHEAVVKLLLDKEDVNVNSIEYGEYGDGDGSDGRPLWMAAGNGHEAVVKLLLNKEGVSVNSSDKHGRTPLWFAAENGHEAVVKLLLDKEGVDVNSKDYGEHGYSGGTPLWIAAENGHEAVVKLLLDKEGVDVDSKSKGVYGSRGGRPLWIAAKKGHEAVVKLLLDKEGVNVNSKDYGEYGNRGGGKPLWIAAEKGHEAVVKLLLDKEGVDVNSKDCGEYGGRSGTPLWIAAENGHKAVVKLLLEKGAKLESKDRI
jgi:ankyrin repeat protein